MPTRPPNLKPDRARKAWSSTSTSRHARGYGTAHDKMRKHLMDTVVLCEECTRQGRVTRGTIADHIKRLADGGTADRSNYQLLCRPCDLDKQARENGGTRKRRITTGLDGWPTKGTE